MKTSLRLTILALGLAIFNVSTAVVRAQYTFETNNGTITITQYTGPGGDVTIPDTITGLSVSGIGESAFYHCSSVTNIIIPNGVTSIGGWAFSWATNLTSITLPTSVTNIAQSAFNYCTSLTSIAIPNRVITIEPYVFYRCSSLTSITIPNTVTSIGEAAFAECHGLNRVTIGNNVTTLGNRAFYTCRSLTGAYFAGNAPNLGTNVFGAGTTATIYYLPGTTGWGPTYGSRPTALWFLPNPIILTTAPGFGIQTNAFGFIISWATNIPVVVEACTNLAGSNWSPAGTKVLTGGWSYFSDHYWTHFPARIYRVRSP